MNEQFRAETSTIRGAIDAILHLYEDESRWTRGSIARNAEGRLCGVDEGTCWCLVGACRLVVPNESNQNALIRHLCRILEMQMGTFGNSPLTLTRFNDNVASIEPIRDLLKISWLAATQ